MQGVGVSGSQLVCFDTRSEKYFLYHEPSYSRDEKAPIVWNQCLTSLADENDAEILHFGVFSRMSGQTT